MRLVYTLLLPGIIVFASQKNLLQVHALVSDDADVPGSSYLGTNAEATAGGESRGLTTLLEKLAVKIPVSWTGSSALSRNALLEELSRLKPKPKTAEQEAQFYEYAAMKLASHFKDLKRQWKRDYDMTARQHGVLVDFYESGQYQTMMTLYSQAFEHLPREHTMSFDEFFTSTFGPKELDILRASESWM